MKQPLFPPSIDEEIKPNIEHYRILRKIRVFEELLLQYYSKGFLRGTTHTYIGQEATAVAALSQLYDGDIVVSNHRSHGHFIAYGGDYKTLLEEIKGKPTGVCHGIGGSQHLNWKNFYSNGILGGMVPVASGMALAEKVLNTSNIAVVFFGDGAMGEGIIYESFNMASLWNVPILFVVEENRYAQSTPIELNMAGSISERSRSFGIETIEIDGNDLSNSLLAFYTAQKKVRETSRPFCVISHTYRMGPHSKGDDFRDSTEIESWRNKDPLLIAKSYFDEQTISEIDREVSKELTVYFEQSFNTSHTSATNPSPIIDTDDTLIPSDSFESSPLWRGPDNIRLVTHLNDVLHNVFLTHPKVHLIGEDILDPYGGAFKVCKGLSSKFPSRIHSSPIAESGILGFANGMAIRGLRPIVEIMFGDFSTLILDQLINHATKFHRMYGGKVTCPVIVRMPMGGYRGYGATHSQTLDKLFLGVPGLTVLACDPIHDQNLIWDRMLLLTCPCIYLENKMLYSEMLKPAVSDKVEIFFSNSSRSHFPSTALQLIPFDTEANVVILTYGGMSSMALSAAKSIFIDSELLVRVIVVTQVSPLPVQDLINLIGQCRRMIVLEEGTRRSGWGSEIAAMLLENLPDIISFRRCSALDTIIPNSKDGEDQVLPSLEVCLSQIKELLNDL